MSHTTAHITECPRDAMQGIKEWISTQDKIRYINQILQCGFDTVDFGSFVSEKAMPQMRDTDEVLKGLHLDNTQSKLLAIVANLRGAQTAAQYDEIALLGFPFSISETFQQRNTNSSIAESLVRVEEIQNLCTLHNKQLIIYISMGFGNPYGDPWNAETAIGWCEQLHEKLGIVSMAPSDTVGIATPESIHYLFSQLIPALPEVKFGAHLHTTPHTWREKVEAAWQAGCYRFDGAIKGFGGCPMAADALTGNMPTENLISYFDNMSVGHGVVSTAFSAAMQIATEIFPAH
ncbi:MAG: hydroxymethylglutaryl-CoA lyase [Flavobacteriales bacterium]